jgi:hypothetical protein
MFSQESKLAVLESKLGIYEDLSREMLSKLEAAVDKISEGNARIATILAKHDERIEQSIKTDELIIRIIDEVKKENKDDHAKVIKRIEGLESKLEEFVKFRWILAGAVIIISFAFSQSPLVVDILTPNVQPARIESTK